MYTRPFLYVKISKLFLVLLFPPSSSPAAQLRHSSTKKSKLTKITSLSISLTKTRSANSTLFVFFHSPALSTLFFFSSFFVERVGGLLRTYDIEDEKSQSVPGIRFRQRLPLYRHIRKERKEICGKSFSEATHRPPTNPLISIGDTKVSQLLRPSERGPHFSKGGRVPLPLLCQHSHCLDRKGRFFLLPPSTFWRECRGKKYPSKNPEIVLRTFFSSPSLLSCTPQPSPP